MNLCYVLARKDFFELGVNGRVSHSRGIIEGLVNNGMDLTVLSSKSANKYCNSKATYPNLIGGFLLWYINLFLFLFKNRNEYDFVIIRYSTSLGWLFCVAMNILYPKRWGFELNGLGYHQWSSAENIKKRIAIKFLKPFENSVIRFSPFINCVSKKLADEIRHLNSNVYILPNAGSSIDISNVNFSHNETPLKIIYFGMYHHYYSLTELAKEISKFSDTNIEIHFFGAGEQESKLISISKNSTNVFVHGRYNLPTLIDKGELSGNVFLILPYKEGTIADYGSPTKLFEYLALGLPIISTSFGQPYDILIDRKEKFPTSVYFYNDNIVEIVKNLYTIEKLEQSKLNDFFNDNHTWNSRCKSYISMINEFIDKK